MTRDGGRPDPRPDAPDPYPGLGLGPSVVFMVSLTCLGAAGFAADGWLANGILGAQLTLLVGFLVADSVCRRRSGRHDPEDGTGPR